MAMYYNGKKVRDLYFNGKCITRLALGKEMTRLVEGDDFVRYEWLKGDGTAYIDTNVCVDVPTLYIKTTVTKPSLNRNSPIFGSRNAISGFGSQIFYLSDSGKFRFDILVSGTNWIWSDVSETNNLIIDCINKVAYINGVVKQSTLTNLSVKNSTNSFRIFSIEILNEGGGTGSNYPYSGSFSDFYLKDSTYEFNFIPCRLLRPIPATLDANGIARNADECGMYNSVNGLFYGNVGSGTFTVSDN